MAHEVDFLGALLRPKVHGQDVVRSIDFAKEQGGLATGMQAEGQRPRPRIASREVESRT